MMRSVKRPAIQCANAAAEVMAIIYRRAAMADVMAIVVARVAADRMSRMVSVVRRHDVAQAHPMASVVPKVGGVSVVRMASAVLAVRMVIGGPMEAARRREVRKVAVVPMVRRAGASNRTLRGASSGLIPMATAC